MQQSQELLCVKKCSQWLQPLCIREVIDCFQFCFKTTYQNCVKYNYNPQFQIFVPSIMMVDDLHSRKTTMTYSAGNSQVIKNKPKIVLKPTVMTNCIAIMEKWKQSQVHILKLLLSPVSCSVPYLVLYMPFRVKSICLQLSKSAELIYRNPRSLRHWNKTVTGISFPACTVETDFQGVQKISREWLSTEV